MHKYLILFLFFPVVLSAQTTDSLLVQKKLKATDTIILEKVSINSHDFKILDLNQKIVSDTLYQINFSQSTLHLLPTALEKYDSIQVQYRKYPDFLTQTYQQFDPGRILHNTNEKSALYQLGEEQSANAYKPFDGLSTTGSISRGITAGTNQNSVLNSKLDLQITGNISDKIKIRASIQDSDIPIQQAGYSQNLNEFDQIFIELYSDNWNIRGGDIDLNQDDSYFGKFHKKVQGLSVRANLNPDGNRTEVFAAGALVKGVFTRNKFDGQEGNQGPYKLHGPNGELYALIISGSESVYVNGIKLKRGEEEDYIIDYNAGEIIFNATYPITSEMRITVEFQYSDRNYSRIAATAGAKYYGDGFEIGGFVYNENDLRNQPLQQDLSDEQKQALADAGDDESKMYASGAVKTPYAENKVLYKKRTLGDREIFVYSTDPDEELYQVKFSKVGKNQGDYILADQTSIHRIFQYVHPIDGVPQGDYAPITRLFAPNKIQMAVINGRYHPSEKTDIQFEIAGSYNDKNLFSNLDKGDNDGYAGHVNIKQNLLTTARHAQLNAFANIDYIHKDFENIEPLYNVEFNRDWNIEDPFGNQSLISAGIEYLDPKKGSAQYSLQNLNYANFSGNRQLLTANLRFGKLTTALQSSYLKSNSDQFTSEFIRLRTEAIYNYKPMWSGVRLELEDNQQKSKTLNQLTPLSQRYQAYEVFTGIGDSTAVYAELGYKHRVTDSLQNQQNILGRAATSNDYYLKSQLIKNTASNLSVYINYRRIKRPEYSEEQPKESSLNSRIKYGQFLFNRFLNWQTIYETNSGTLPQQEFTYVEVDPGKGDYMWIDYNGDGIQDIDEFEIATYPDEAKYIRVLLPNQIFLKTRQTKLSQIVSLNFGQLQKQGKNAWLSHFYNQTSYLVDRKVHKEGNGFNLNPFSSAGEELAVNLNFRNTLYFNRGKQHYSTSYTYLSSENKNLFSSGLQSAKLESHQLDFNHKLGESWVFRYKNELNRSSNQSENFANRDYRINGIKFNPQVSYLFNPNLRFDFFYQYYQRENNIGEEEKLGQQKLGTSFSFSKADKYSFSGELSYIYNHFNGNSFSPVAFEMLQGLQPDKNFTWEVLFQKKITNYLDLNLSYFGRKSEEIKAIHTGSIQLKAYF